MKQFNRDFFAGWLTGVATIVAAVLISLLASCAPTDVPRVDMPVRMVVSPATAAPIYQGSDPVYRLSDINIDQPETYPPMPDGTFAYVDDSAHRQHYELSAIVSEVVGVGKDSAMHRNAVSTAVLFDDGTGLVLLSFAWLDVTSGPAMVKYSIPPAGDPTAPMAVLIHSIR